MDAKKMTDQEQREREAYERGRREGTTKTVDMAARWMAARGFAELAEHFRIDVDTAERLVSLATHPPSADAKPATASARAVHESHFSEPLNERLPCGHIGADCCNCATPSARPTCETCSGVGENTLFEPPRPCSDCNGTGRAP